MGTRYKKINDIKTNVTAHIKSTEKRNLKRASGRSLYGFQNMRKPIDNILKATVRGHIGVVHGIQGVLWLLGVLVSFKMQQSRFFLPRPCMVLHICSFARSLPLTRRLYLHHTKLMSVEK